LVLADLKTEGSERTIPISPEVVAFLRAWKVQQAKERLAAGELWQNDDDLVFTTPQGRPCDPDNFGHKLGKITKAAGLGHWTTHELRHSAGTLMFAMGKEVRYITEILGHSSDRVTRDVYLHPQVEGKADALNALSEVLFSRRQTDTG
jgi:integrase